MLVGANVSPPAIWAKFEFKNYSPQPLSSLAPTPSRSRLACPRTLSSSSKKIAGDCTPFWPLPTPTIRELRYASKPCIAVCVQHDYRSCDSNLCRCTSDCSTLRLFSLFFGQRGGGGGHVARFVWVKRRSLWCLGEVNFPSHFWANYISGSCAHCRHRTRIHSRLSPYCCKVVYSLIL